VALVAHDRAIGQWAPWVKTNKSLNFHITRSQLYEGYRILAGVDRPVADEAWSITRAQFEASSRRLDEIHQEIEGNLLQRGTVAMWSTYPPPRRSIPRRNLTAALTALPGYRDA
jgi:hypothetical protein